MKYKLFVSGILIIGTSALLGGKSIQVHASSYAKTTPKSIRGEWFRTLGDAGYANIKIGPKTFRYVNGGMGYSKYGWGPKIKASKLGKKVKTDKVVVISKHANKHGYWRVKLRNSDDGFNQTLYLKRIKVSGKYKLRVNNDGGSYSSDRFWIASKKQMKIFKALR